MPWGRLGTTKRCTQPSPTTFGLSPAYPQLHPQVEQFLDILRKHRLLGVFVFRETVLHRFSTQVIPTCGHRLGKLWGHMGEFSPGCRDFLGDGIRVVQLDVFDESETALRRTDENPRCRGWAVLPPVWPCAAVVPSQDRPVGARGMTRDKKKTDPGGSVVDARVGIRLATNAVDQCALDDVYDLPKLTVGHQLAINLRVGVVNRGVVALEVASHLRK